MEEVPGPQASLLVLDEQRALPRKDEERLLVRLGVVEARLSRLQDGDVDPELGELDRRVAVLVLEGAPRAPRLREPPLGVAHVDDEPALGDGREPRSGVLELRFGHGSDSRSHVGLRRCRLYAATGDGIARLDEAGGAWDVELSLAGSGAQCLALDPSDPDTVYAGLREGGVRRTTDGGRTWVDCALPEPGVFSLAVSAADGAVYAGTEPSALFRSDDRGETWRELDAPARASVAPDLELPAAAVDVARALDRAEPARRRICSSSGSSSVGSCARPTAARRGQTTGPGRSRTSTRSPGIRSVAGRAYEAGGGGAAWSDDAGETWQPADEGRDRNYTWSVAVDPDDPELWYVSASTGPFAAHGGRDPQALIYR